MRCSMSSVSGSDDEPLDPRPVAGLSGNCPSNAASPRCSLATGRFQPNSSGRPVAVEPKSPLRAPRPGRSRHVKFPAPERT
jgi:hypothetical protein